MQTMASRDLEKSRVIQQLEDRFGKVLDMEIIESVAYNCSFDKNKSSSILLELTSNVNVNPKQKKPKQKPKNIRIAPGNNDPDVIIESEKEIILDKRKMDTNLYSVPSPASPSVVSSSVPRKKSNKELDLQRIIHLAKGGVRMLILMRGLPGSGKSTLARYIVDQAIGSADYRTFILSADDFFILPNGMYQYDKWKIQDAHTWNQRRASESTRNGVSPIIIDNTNTQMWEMKCYASMAVDAGYLIEVLEPHTYWLFNEKELARRNKHGVPRLKIKEMLDKYEKNITPQKILSMYSLLYRIFKPPVPRIYPSIHIDNEKTSNKLFNNGSGRNSGFCNGFIPNNFSASPQTNFTNDVSFIPKRWVAMGTNTQSNFVNNVSANQKYSGSPLAYFNREPNDVNQLKTVKLVNIDGGSPEKEKVDTINISDDESVEAVTIISIDDILTCKHENDADILKPKICKMDDKFKLNPFTSTGTENSSLELMTTSENNLTDNKPSSLKEGKKHLYPVLDLASWGLKESSLASWDIVNPVINPSKVETDSKVDKNVQESEPLVTTDSSTNTCRSDFAVLQYGPGFKDDVKILTAQIRDISLGVSSVHSSVLKISMLDKSCMTNEDILLEKVSTIDELISLFPKIPVDYLRDLHEKCHGDGDWVVNLLLDDNKEALSSVISVLPVEEPKLAESVVVQNISEEQRAEEIALIEEAPAETLKHDKVLEIEEIKKCIEEKVDINRGYYSEHVLKIKDIRHGNCLDSVNKASSSKATDDTCMTPTEEIVIIDSDGDLDDFEPGIQTEDYSESDEEFTEFNLGEVFAKQLESKFGHSNLLYPDGFQPVVQLPMSFARQLHAFYLESIYQQIEKQDQVLQTMIKEDEAFAKKLQEREVQQHQMASVSTPNLQEVMDSEVAQNVYKNEIEQWKRQTPDDLASKLTRQKLFNLFPKLDQITLVEILQAHNNCYQDTVDVLIASTDLQSINDPDGTLRLPPITSEIVEEMKAAQESTQGDGEVDESRNASSYREEAFMHARKRQELYKKGQQAIQKGMREVALFYSDLAQKQTQYYDRAHSMAAAAFIHEHSNRIQNFDTLDLHYLFVKEAVAALDIFIDRNIMLLGRGNKRSQNLFVITGRGNNSNNKVSRIKPVVKQRLLKRNIKFVFLNPGLLKIRVCHNSIVTSDLQ